MNSNIKISSASFVKKRFLESLFNAHQWLGAKSYDCNICEKTLNKHKERKFSWKLYRQIGS